MRELKLNPTITERGTDSIHRYLTEIAKIPLLNVDEEIRLAKKIREGDQAALHRLVSSNLRFVVSVAKKYQHNGLSLGDLINEGNLGLIKAAVRFDHTKGFKFISFAVWWIRQTIILAISEQTRIIRLPLNIINSINHINKASVLLEQQLERQPTQGEIADGMSMAEPRLKNHLCSAPRTLHLDNGLNADSKTPLLDTIAGDMTTPDHHFYRMDQAYDIATMLRCLSERDGNIIKMHFGLTGKIPMSLEEIGRQLCLSKERVRQIRDGAVKKLRLRALRQNFNPTLFP
ncbi:RNA polymerase sigma factor RpoD/SigA [Pedobacter sp. MC2016-15]|uniref:sigma-70 family RNA polymerase sigma factor n=1 Tax=Pedobacter sp. MC2016-15 TaxID=2994473 RepID=UPI0022470D53|nr:RNA polymerase sigma factor RpoD/SigA [Pedobacter sp. MC2016-15]MCX2477495.1 RNA polymerase sigma factor RpoD/SigA [Pedobacter sp. MC2016-15]